MHQLKVENSLTLVSFQAIFACAESPSTITLITITRGDALVTPATRISHGGHVTCSDCHGTAAFAHRAANDIRRPRDVRRPGHARQARDGARARDAPT